MLYRRIDQSYVTVHVTASACHRRLLNEMDYLGRQVDECVKVNVALEKSTMAQNVYGDNG